MKADRKSLAVIVKTSQHQDNFSFKIHKKSYEKIAQLNNCAYICNQIIAICERDEIFFKQ